MLTKEEVVKVLIALLRGKMRPRLEDLRIKMLEKCFDCFCKNGLENTSTKKLAEACGMTDGNIFHYFASKDEIIIKST